MKISDVLYNNIIFYRIVTIDAHVLQYLTLLSKTSNKISLTTKRVSFRNLFRTQNMKINSYEKWKYDKKKVGTLDVFCNGWLFLDCWDTRVSRVHGRIIMKIYSIQSLLHFGTCFVGKEGICSSKKKSCRETYIYYVMCSLFQDLRTVTFSKMDQSY